VTILDAMADAALFASAFPPTESWAAWRAFLGACFGLPMTDEQRAFYRQHTGRQTPPTGPAREAWLIVGRRGGKSRIAALVAVYLACFRDYRSVLAPGERGTLPIIAADRRQARTVFCYVTGLLDSCPMLARMVSNRTAESIELTNGVTIEVHTASFRSVRGYTVVSCVLDEVAFWRTEDSANPDREIVNALRPAMATVPGALLLAISSPYARRGCLWDAYRQHHGRDGDLVLVWQAPTRAMNPTVPEAVIAAAYAEDEAAAAAECAVAWTWGHTQAIHSASSTAWRQPRSSANTTGFTTSSGVFVGVLGASDTRGSPAVLSASQVSLSWSLGIVMTGSVPATGAPVTLACRSRFQRERLSIAAGE